ncbi:hypothetical protein ABZ442_05085 [Streptomyces triculaminicus]|uniref:hypothetical protein n=1 Tax=Streptomyces triculaminicus TaxID=2816232 RepID=UPI003402340A
MTTEPAPKIADDGIQDVPLTVARALLTRLIEQVREDDLVSALTVRGRRRAYLVTPDFYERAIEDGGLLEGLRRYLDELAAREQTASVVSNQRIIKEALDAAERRCP